MFKGITKEFQERLEKFNEESEFFIFNFTDLEQGDYGKHEEDNNKYYLYSKELKQKLAKIIHERQQPGENIPTPKSFFLNSDALYFGKSETLCRDFAFEYNLWFVFSKDSLYQMAKKGADRKMNGFLIYDGEGEERSSLVLPFSYEIWEIVQEEEEEINYLWKIIIEFRQSNVDQINQVIEETKIDISELEINYLEILPDHCCCEVEVNPDGVIKDHRLYLNHILFCLGRSEQEITDFKEKILEQIQLGKERFENYQNSIINEIKALCTEKGVNEKSDLYSNWENRLLNMRFRKNLEEEKLSLIKCIESCAKAADEAAREEIRKKAQKEADRLVREQEEKKKQADQAKVQREKTENLQREKEQKTREKELEKHLKEEKNKHNLPEEFEHLSLTEIQEKVKILLNQSLTTNSLQITDLPPEFHQWEEQLEKMKTKEEVFLYQSFIMQAIERKLESRKTTTTDRNDKQSPLSLLVIVGGTTVLALFLFFLVKKVKKNA